MYPQGLEVYPKGRNPSTVITLSRHRLSRRTHLEQHPIAWRMWDQSPAHLEASATTCPLFLSMPRRLPWEALRARSAHRRRDDEKRRAVAYPRYPFHSTFSCRALLFMHASGWAGSKFAQRQLHSQPWKICRIRHSGDSCLSCYLVLLFPVAEDTEALRLVSDLFTCIRAFYSALQGRHLAPCGGHSKVQCPYDPILLRPNGTKARTTTSTYRTLTTWCPSVYLCRSLHKGRIHSFFEFVPVRSVLRRHLSSRLYCWQNVHTRNV